MRIISHRINTLEQLTRLDQKHGAEIDLRTSSDRIILQHDPFMPGEDFEKWIQSYKHGTLILNVKEDGLEKRLIEIMARQKIEDYFFLDVTIPTLYKWSTAGFKKFAARLSEIEPIESIQNLQNRVEWVWVDCFTQLPVERMKALASLKLKTCLVSPELVRGNLNEIKDYQKLLHDHSLKVDAVCTKSPSHWASV